MNVIDFSETRRDECADFWWHLYEDLPYVHLPDGYQNVNSHTHITPDYFLNRLDWGLRCDTPRRWHGEVRDDTVFLVIDNESVVGMMVCSVSQEESKGSILAAYMRCDLQGRQAAALLVDSALQFFQNSGLKQAVAGPDMTKSLEAERPTHLALLDAGFRWTGELTPWVITDEEDEPYAASDYETFLGGSLVGFKVSEEIEQKIDTLKKNGVSIEKFTSGFMNPFHGGIHPFSDQNSRLYNERFRGRVVKRKGAQGVVWEGVRVSCTFQHERFRGKSMSVDYLLAPGAETVAIVAKCWDTLGVWSDLRFGLDIWPNFPISPKKTRFWLPGEVKSQVLTPAHYMPGGTWQWGGVVTRDGRGLFVSANGADTRVAGESIDTEMGCLIRANVEQQMPAHGALEGLSFVVPGSAEDGEHQAIWQAFDRLP